MIRKANKQKQYRFSRGFTLIELLVVISIIGLLSSVVMASVTAARKQGMIAAGQKFDAHTHSAFYDDLVLSWDFDRDTAGSGSIIDLSGKGNNLGYTTGPGLLTGPSSVQNVFKTGKSFYKDSNHVAQTGTLSVGVPLKDPPTGNFTISFWLYPTSIGAATNYLSSLSGTTEKTWKFAYATGGTSGFTFSLRAGSLKDVSVGQLPLNTWHHIAAVCNTNKIGVYVNGKLSGTTNLGSSCSGLVDSVAVYIGQSNTLPFYVDNVRIYKQALPI